MRRRKQIHVADAEGPAGKARVVGEGKTVAVGKGIGASFKVLGSVKIDKAKTPRERS